MIKINFKRYFLYLIRWQLSTPILAVCLVGLASIGPIWGTVVANLVGGLLFFWVDRYIFQSRKLDASWQVEENIKCCDCGITARGYRLVTAKNYDRSSHIPEFRCEKCSISKVKILQDKGVVL